MLPMHLVAEVLGRANPPPPKRYACHGAPIAGPHIHQQRLPQATCDAILRKQRVRRKCFSIARCALMKHLQRAPLYGLRSLTMTPEADCARCRCSSAQGEAYHPSVYVDEGFCAQDGDVVRSRSRRARPWLPRDEIDARSCRLASSRSAAPRLLHRYLCRRLGHARVTWWIQSDALEYINDARSDRQLF